MQQYGHSVTHQRACRFVAAGIPEPQSHDAGVGGQPDAGRLLDFDTLSRAPGIPAACGQNNKHYSCHLRSPGPNFSGVNYFRDPNHQVRAFDTFDFMPVSGMCDQSVAGFPRRLRKSWQWYFAVLTNPGGARRLVRLSTSATTHCICHDQPYTHCIPHTGRLCMRRCHWGTCSAARTANAMMT